MLAWQSTAAAALQQGERLVLAVVVAVRGTAPLGPGAMMAVGPDNRLYGGLGGGCSEARLLSAVAPVRTSGQAANATLTARPDGLDVTAATGATCGAEVTVALQPLTSTDAAWLAGEEYGVRSWPCAHPAQVSWQPLVAMAADAIPAGKSFLDAAGVFHHAVLPPRRLVLVGAVPVAEVLARLAIGLGWGVIVVDPRAAFLEAFPDAAGVVRHRGWPAAVFPGLALSPRDALLTLSHDARIDDAAFLALPSPGPGYRGALGSARTHAARCARLREGGLEAAAVDRIDGPAGLFKGTDPTAMAVSMLAGIVAALPADHA